MRHLHNFAIQERKVSKPPLPNLRLHLLTAPAVAIAGYYINYATEVRSNTSSALGAIYLAVAQGCFAIGRFSGSLAMKFVKPR